AANWSLSSLNTIPNMRLFAPGKLDKASECCQVAVYKEGGQVNHFLGLRLIGLVIAPGTQPCQSIKKDLQGEHRRVEGLSRIRKWVGCRREKDQQHVRDCNGNHTKRYQGPEKFMGKYLPDQIWLIERQDFP